VTLHWVAPQVDAGPIAFKAQFSITEQDTGISVSAKCVQYGLPLISQLLALLSHNPDAIPRVNQDPTRRQYFGRDAPHQGWVLWRRSAKQVVNFVRACDYGPWPSPWKMPRTKSSRTGVEINILRASRIRQPTSASPGTVGRSESDGVFVAAGDEWVLVSRARIDGTSVPPVTVLGAGDFLEEG
jgi:methionyl-tRNA formyltransferase